MHEVCCRCRVGTPGRLPHPQDGDVLDVWTVARIRWHHLCDLSNTRNLPPMTNGYKPWNTEHRAVREQTALLKYERVNSTTMRETDLETGIERTFGPSVIDLRAYLGRKLANPMHGIFLSPTNVPTWYAGTRPVLNLDAAWAAVEGISDIRESESRYQLTPKGNLEVKQFMYVRLDTDVDDATVGAMTGRDRLPDEPEPRRGHYGCDYDGIVGIDTALVRDQTTAYVPDGTFTLGTHVVALAALTAPDKEIVMERIRGDKEPRAITRWERERQPIANRVRSSG